MSYHVTQKAEIGRQGERGSGGAKLTLSCHSGPFILSYYSYRESNFQEMHPNAFTSQKILLLLDLLILSSKISFAQSITAITQAPRFSSLSPCAQRVAKAVIDGSTNPECPAGSSPSCFCEDQSLSKECSDQISTNVLISCSTSPRRQATSAASVFAAYCSAGEGIATADTTTDGRSTSTTAAKGTTSTTAQNQAASTTVASPTTSSQTSDTETASSGGLDPSDKIAIGIGVPVGLAGVLAAWFGWKHYQGHSLKIKNVM